MKRTMARLWRGIGLTTAILWLTLLCRVPVAAGTPYTDPQGRFELVVPDGYDLRGADAIGIAFLASNIATVYTSETYPDAGMLVSVLPNDPHVRPSVVIALEAIRDIKAQASAHLIGLVPDMAQGTILADMPAVRVEYTYEARGVRMRVAQLAVQDGTSLFVLTVAAHETDFDAVYEDAKVMLDSFRLSHITPRATNIRANV